MTIKGMKLEKTSSQNDFLEKCLECNRQKTRFQGAGTCF